MPSMCIAGQADNSVEGGRRMTNANAQCMKCGEWYDRSVPQCRHSRTHIQNYWDDDGVPHRGRNIRLCSRCTIDLELWLLGADE